MWGRKIVLVVLVCLFAAPAAFCQSEMLKSVVNNLAYYRQKKDLKYLTGAKKSVDSLFKTHADSINVEKNVYRALVYSSILYIDSLNKLKQPASLFTQTVDLVEKLSGARKIYKFQTELDFSKRCLANIYIRRAFKYLYNADYLNSELSFQKAQHYDPAFVPLNAYINSKLGNMEQTAKYYHNLIKSDSTKTEYVEVAANSYQLIGDTAKALEILKKARKFLPGDKFLLLDEANIYNNQKDYKALRPLLKPLIDIDPNNPEIAFVAANCYDHLSQYDKAESLYLQSIENNSTAYEPIFNLGLLYLKQSAKKDDPSKKDITYAAKWLEKANEISPNDIKCLKLLQIVYTQVGNNNQLNRINNKLRDIIN
jgi:tetratricopeptide (TPR) repeat protein